MKKINIVSRIIVILAAALIILNRFLIKVPDWGVRVAGIVMAVMIVVMAFTSVRLRGRRS